MKLNLGNQLRLNRRRMNLTQEQLAEEFGTSPQAVSRWENGTTYPDIEMLPVIASFFEISVDSLLGRTEEEKQKACDEIQKAFQTAVRTRNIEKTIELLREMRRNLNEYKNCWFWGIYHEIWNARLFHNEKVLEEMRLLAEKITTVCPKDEQFGVIGWMADMEDEEHIEAFLDAYASRNDMDRSSLLFHRYKMREELDKIEPVRQYILWKELSDIVSTPNDWQVYLCKDPNHFIWYCETQLNYLNAVNCLKPDNEHIISGGIDIPDLWCTERILLGLRYTASFAKLNIMDKAFDAFEDTIRVIEQVMSIKDDEFELGCSSPALKEFTLKSGFYWSETNGIEYKNLYIEKNDWCNCIVPLDYQKSMQESWFDSMRADRRFESLFERLNNCVICRRKDTD